MIKRDSKLRERFSSCSTGNENATHTGHTGYYSSKGLAINAFDNALQEYNLCFDRDEMVDCNGDSGRRTFTIVDGDNERAGFAVISWYRMEPSGNYEFTGYIT